MNYCQKVVIALMVWLVSWSGNSALVQAEPNLSAAGYLLLESATGQVLTEKNGYEQRPPASTTKILTCITALDLAHLDEIATVTINADRVGDASIYLTAGEKFTLESLLQGALIKSGNDATVAIAEQVAGDERLFMDLANRKARTLGAVRTEFYNPHGLPHPKHVTTAYDLALIANYAMGNPVFAEMVKTRETSISSLNSRRKVNLKNTNKLLWNDPRIIGVKTGTTDRAGKCLVTAAEHEGRILIGVVLKSGDRFGNSQRLLDWGFQQFCLQGLPETAQCMVLDVKHGTPTCITVRPAYQPVWSLPEGTEISIDLELPASLVAPIRQGETVGKIIVMTKGELLEEVPLIAGEKVERVRFSILGLITRGLFLASDC